MIKRLLITVAMLLCATLSFGGDYLGTSCIDISEPHQRVLQLAVTNVNNTSFILTGEELDAAGDITSAVYGSATFEDTETWVVAFAYDNTYQFVFNTETLEGDFDRYNKAGNYEVSGSASVVPCDSPLTGFIQAPW